MEIIAQIVLGGIFANVSGYAWVVCKPSNSRRCLTHGRWNGPKVQGRGTNEVKIFAFERWGTVDASKLTNRACRSIGQTLGVEST